VGSGERGGAAAPGRSRAATANGAVSGAAPGARRIRRLAKDAPASTCGAPRCGRRASVGMPGARRRRRRFPAAELSSSRPASGRKIDRAGPPSPALAALTDLAPAPQRRRRGFAADRGRLGRTARTRARNAAPRRAFRRPHAVAGENAALEQRWGKRIAAPSLGPAVERSGTMTAAPGWRSATAVETSSGSKAPSPVTEASGAATWSSKGPTCAPSSAPLVVSLEAGI
jgi:hypothetical protein